jgi:hypothetical protein
MKHSKHKLTYVDFYPEGLKENREPGPIRIFIGAVIAMAALYFSLVFLFSL